MLSVLFYKDTENPERIPGNWPCEIKILYDGDPLPVAPWQMWNELEFESYMGDPALIAAKEEWNNYNKGVGTVVYQTIAQAVITDVNVMSGYSLKPYDHKTGKMYVLPNTIVRFRIEIQTLDSQLMENFTDLFMLPLAGELQPTRLIAVQFVNGISSTDVKFKSGLYEVTETLLNRELPPESQIHFDGLRVYVVETSAN